MVVIDLGGLSSKVTHVTCYTSILTQRRGIQSSGTRKIQTIFAEKAQQVFVKVIFQGAFKGVIVPFLNKQGEMVLCLDSKKNGIFQNMRKFILAKNI